MLQPAAPRPHQCGPLIAAQNDLRSMGQSGCKLSSERAGLLQLDPHGLRAALTGTVVHGLDVVAVGVQQECCETARVVGSLAGRAVVPPAIPQARIVELAHSSPIPGLKRDMNTPGELPARGTERGDEKLVCPEVIRCAPVNRHPKRRQHGGVEHAAAFEVGDHKLDMIDQPTAVKLVSRQVRSPCTVADGIGDQMTNY